MTAEVELSVSLAELQALHGYAKGLHLNNLLIKNRSFSGDRTSSSLGRGLEFNEVRSYQVGDDLRHLDWKLTARLGQPYTRVYQEEHQRPVMLFVDLASQLQLGQAGSKAVLAAKLAALLGWSALQDKDWVGGWIETDQQSYWQPPIKQAREFSPYLARLARLTQNLGELKPRAPEQLDKSLDAFARRLPKGALAVAISDWVGWTNPDVLKRLAQRGSLLLVHLTDPLDQNLPTNAGPVILQGKLQPVTANLQAAWQAAFLKRVADLKAAVGQQASYLQLSTSHQESWWKALLPRSGYAETTGINL
ncbi:DUF58 domain-containing protein [Marinospirillum insulare]|uniref:DUF58 domain-containing protein n=1 Tax=Marinospirillum insulare TaxID=217169 RepID=A0ABQ5ZXJ6_9GAMM|nr:DUF58 domain-containing protein [Marinospirillum insulare]GLR64211.1 hypothetical protein GCM10007878_16490 [Marinospirillum insulare]